MIAKTMFELELVGDPVIPVIFFTGTNNCGFI